MSLVQLSPRVHVWRGGVNLGLIEAPGKRLILVDSGLDSSGARKALKPFLEAGYTLAAIINTHSHADHIGGNADLVRRTGCQVWAKGREIGFIRFPDLEPLALYGGAQPVPALEVKFLQAEPTLQVNELPASGGLFQVEGVELELVHLCGHAIDLMGVAIDGVLLVGDAIFHPNLLAKHPVIFLVNVAEYIGSLDIIAGRPERYVVPGHGEILDRQAEEGDQLPPVLAANRESLARLQDAILQAASAGPVPGEELLYGTMSVLGRKLETEAQYFLDRAAVSAHISDLVRQNRLKVQFVDGRRLLST